MKKLNKGFTLIELLVVIAIIGILSAVVVANLNSARTKGADAAVKGNMSNIRSQAEIYYDNNSNSYGVSANTCTFASSMMVDGPIAQAIVQINANDSTTVSMACNTDATGQKWAISTTLKSGTTWCVDNQGFNKAGAAAAGICS
jgi:type IV pilus assembly protein PilA